MAWTVDIDGTNITSYCQSINWHPRWSRPATCVVSYPGHLYSTTVGSELHLYNGATLVFSGPVWHVEASGGPDRTDTEVTAYDHLIYMTKRLCKQGETDPSPFNLVEIWPTIAINVTAPQIMKAFVESALADPNAQPPVKELPWIVGAADAGVADVTSTPMNTPMTLDQMRQNLLSTGELAINVTPGIGASTLDFIRPPDVPGGPVATFEYQTGAYNSQTATDTKDMDEIINALWYLLGPRGPKAGPTAANRPRGIPINHWGGSITPTAANAGGDGEGGEPGAPWPPALVSRFMGSRNTYGYFQEIRVFDDMPDTQAIRPFYEMEWAKEAWLRSTPREFVGIVPERGVSPTFNVGDFVQMNAGSRLNGGYSGSALVFEFEVQINVNGVVAITEIVASTDETGA